MLVAVLEKLSLVSVGDLFALSCSGQLWQPKGALTHTSEASLFISVSEHANQTFTFTISRTVHSHGLCPPMRLNERPLSSWFAPPVGGWSVVRGLQEVVHGLVSEKYRGRETNVTQLLPLATCVR